MQSSAKTFLKLGSGSAFVTLVRTLAAFIVNKFLAIVLGPGVFAGVAQFQNLFALGQGVSSLSLQNGWVSLTARFKNKETELLGVWRGGYRLTIFATIFVCVAAVLFVFIAPLESMFPGIPKRYIQAAIFFALPGIAASNITLICTSVLNGLGEYRRWALASIATSVLQTLWVIILLYTHALSLLAVIATQSLLSVCAAVPLASRAGFSIKKLVSTQAYRAENRKPWFEYAAMGLVPMILAPLTLLWVRQLLANRYGWDVAGNWQGVYRISDFFNVGVSSVLSVVLLPKLASTLSKQEFQKFFYPLLIKIMAIAGVVASVFFLFRKQVIQFFLSNAFSGAESFLLYQLPGDVLRSGGWCCALVLIAQCETKKFLSAEIFFGLFFPIASIFLFKVVGASAPSLAYTLENALYFITTLILVKSISWNK